MEFVQGKTLKQFISERFRLSEAEALNIAAAVGSALAHAAAHGVLHRDVKPENIFVSSDGMVKLGDWGLAKAESRELELTRTGLTVGSPYYIAPEQARAARNVSPAVDVYALGATLFHALTGRPPFVGSSPLEVMSQHVTKAAPDPREMAPEVRPETAALVLQLLEKDPARRPSAAEMVERLHALQATLEPALAT
jgi:serine/threonine-protein kinase